MCWTLHFLIETGNGTWTCVVFGFILCMWFFLTALLVTAESVRTVFCFNKLWWLHEPQRHRAIGGSSLSLHFYLAVPKVSLYCIGKLFVHRLFNRLQFKISSSVFESAALQKRFWFMSLQTVLAGVLTKRSRAFASLTGRPQAAHLLRKFYAPLRVAP